MFVLTSTIALTMAVYIANPMEEALDSYNDCLIGKLLEHLDQKSTKKGFEKASETTCDKERQHFRKLVITDERDFGSSQAEAESYADEEVRGVINSHVENYGEYLKSGTRPQR